MNAALLDIGGGAAPKPIAGHGPEPLPTTPGPEQWYQP